MSFDSSNLPPGVKAAMQRAPVIAETEGKERFEEFKSEMKHWEETAKTFPTPSKPIVSFFCAGKPEPSGSKQAFVPTNKTTGEPYRGPGGRIIVNVVDDNPKSKAWKKIVAYTARMHYHDAPLLGPLECKFEFIVKRPLSHFGTGRNEGVVKDSAQPFPTSKPDTLKLSRGTEDALTEIIWQDDAQVVTQTATKRYGSVEGVTITISRATVIATGSPTLEQLELKRRL